MDQRATIQIGPLAAHGRLREQVRRAPFIAPACSCRTSQDRSPYWCRRDPEAAPVAVSFFPRLWSIRAASSLLTLKWGRRFGLTSTIWPVRGFRPVNAL